MRDPPHRSGVPHEGNRVIFQITFRIFKLVPEQVDSRQPGGFRYNPLRGGGDQMSAVPIRQLTNHIPTAALIAAAGLDRHLRPAGLLAFAWVCATALPQSARPRPGALVAVILALFGAAVAQISESGFVALLIIVPSIILVRVPARFVEVIAATAAMALVLHQVPSPAGWLVVLKFAVIALAAWWWYPHRAPPRLAHQLAHDLRGDLSSVVWMLDGSISAPPALVAASTSSALDHVVLAEQVFAGPPPRSHTTWLDPQRTPMIPCVLRPQVKDGALIYADSARFDYGCAVLSAVLDTSQAEVRSERSRLILVWSGPAATRLDRATLVHIRVMLGPGHQFFRKNGMVELVVRSRQGVPRRARPAPCIPWPKMTKSL